MINSEFDLETKSFWDLLEYKIGLLRICKEIERNTFNIRDSVDSVNQDEYRYAQQLYKDIKIIENVVRIIDEEIKKKLMNLSDDDLLRHYNVLVGRLGEARNEIEKNNNLPEGSRKLFYPLKQSTLDAYEDLDDCFKEEYARRGNKRGK